jgi:hypothetical protein
VSTPWGEASILSLSLWLRALFHPPIRNPEVVALFKGLHASRAARPAPKVVAESAGEATARWAAEAQEVPVAYPTPEPVPQVLLNCTEEKPVATMPRRRPARDVRTESAMAIALRAANEMFIDTDPGPDEVAARVGSAGALRAVAPESVERGPGVETVMLPARRRRRVGLLVMGAVVGLAVALCVAAFIGRAQQERTQPERTALRPTVQIASAVAPVPLEPRVTATPASQAQDPTAVAPGSDVRSLASAAPFKTTATATVRVPPRGSQQLPPKTSAEVAPPLDPGNSPF